MSLPRVHYERRDPHRVTIVVRPASATRRAITITVHQTQDVLGNWLIPTITFSEAVPQSSEDVMFLKSIAEGLMVACLEFLAMMDYVK